MKNSVCLLLAQVVPVLMVVIAVKDGFLAEAESRRQRMIEKDPTGFLAMFPPDGPADVVAWLMRYRIGGRLLVISSGVLEAILVVGAQLDSGLAGNLLAAVGGYVAWTLAALLLAYTTLDLSARAFPGQEQPGLKR